VVETGSCSNEILFNVFLLKAALRYEKETGLPEDEVPSLRSMLGLRKLPNSTEVNQSYVYFCTHFLKCVVGIVNYKKLLGQGCKLSKVATPSDEALALLLIENSIHRWTREFEIREVKGEQHQIKEDELVPSKFTSSGSNKRQKGLTKRYKGWTQAGIQRFNVLLDQVKEDRRVNGIIFDESFASILNSYH
jgi:hypothetical protein